MTWKPLRQRSRTVDVHELVYFSINTGSRKIKKREV